MVLAGTCYVMGDFLGSIVLEQWIRAKYERKEFLSTLKADYTGGDLECFLMKRGKKDGRYHLRKFLVEYNAGLIKYFVKQVKLVVKSLIDLVINLLITRLIRNQRQQLM